MRHKSKVTTGFIEEPNDVIGHTILIRLDEVTGDVSNVVLVMTDGKTLDVMTRRIREPGNKNKTSSSV